MPSLPTLISLGVIVFAIVMGGLGIHLVENNNQKYLNTKLYFAGFVRGEEAAHCSGKSEAYASGFLDELEDEAV